jgi:uncharacterized protein (UPF0276 family)
MEDLMMDLIDCLSDTLEYIDDDKFRKHICNTIRMAEGRLEYQALIRNDAEYNS